MQRQLQELHATSNETELNRLKELLDELEAENADLKTELNAFDPAFFEEIEDLKHEHHQLSIKCNTQETVIRDLSRQLGVAPPL